MFGSKRLEFLYLMYRYMEKHIELSLYYHREQENFTYSEKESRIIHTQFFFRAPALTNVRETWLSALRIF